MNDKVTSKYISDISEQLARQISNKVTMQNISPIQKNKLDAALKHLKKKMGAARAKLLYQAAQIRAKNHAIETYSNLTYNVIPDEKGKYDVIGSNLKQKYYCGTFDKERDAWFQVARLKHGNLYPKGGQKG